MSSRRQQRVAELLLEEITLITMEMTDPRLALVTVTDVEVTPDLKHAHVYVTYMDDDEDRESVLEGLRHATGFVRRELAQRALLRYVPELSFHWDPSVQRGQRIDELLRQIGLD